MIQYIIIISFLFFLISLIHHPYRSYTTAIAWISMILLLIFEIPAWLADHNYVYPALTCISIILLGITLRILFETDTHKKELIFQLTRAAGVAFIIYAPFAFYEPFGNWLIAQVVQQTGGLLTLLGHPTELFLWNTFRGNGYSVEIILACTGIQAISIMLGVTYAVKTTFTQKIIAALMIVPPIYILNLFRNAGVIMAYTEQWFPYFQTYVGGEQGFASFFWAHNIIAEGLAFLFLLVLAYGLFCFIPTLADVAIDILRMYKGEIESFLDRNKIKMK
ncbi:MAG: archaeosortase A [Methanomicrobiales archaeon]|jgi:archaeosortase A (PGF-CTERM-specific)|nr:archaeosortase A [Methanomicrobiales archaeon]